MLIFEVDGWKIYTGKSKPENLELIRLAFPTDYWFHMEDAQSAHVFLRMPIMDTKPAEFDDVPPSVKQGCFQLVKESSNSKKQVVLYTKVSNLKTTGDKKMDCGFINDLEVSKTSVKIRKAEILDNLKKHKQEKNVDLEQEWIDFQNELRTINSEEYRAQKKYELEQSRQYKQLAEAKARGYTDLFDEDALQSSSNQNRPEDWEDDFM